MGDLTSEVKALDVGRVRDSDDEDEWRDMVVFYLFTMDCFDLLNYSILPDIPDRRFVFLILVDLLLSIRILLLFKHVEYICELVIRFALKLQRKRDYWICLLVMRVRGSWTKKKNPNSKNVIWKIRN